MSKNQIRLFDEGTRFLLTIQDDSVVVDLSSATTLSLVFVKPSGEVVSRTPLLYTDGTDGNVYYDTDSTLLDEIGLWKFQVALVFPSGSWKTDIRSFRVYPNLS